jgi:pyruvate/2-oxoglutarate dehydrogenase complex dihydrolipoamide dehydrogenase (E3) component
MSGREFDVVVVGLGPGGEFVAGSLADAGLAVAGVEDSLVGGECPYWGCVPSKMMIRAANLLAEGRRIPGMAGQEMIAPSWAPVAARIRAEATDDWDDQVAADRLTGKGAALLRGHGRITAPGQVTVGGEVLTARRAIVLNCGTAPVIPPVDGLAGTPLWTNHQAIEAEDVPESLIVLGGGPIGAELSQVFARFGSLVTVVEMAGRLLDREEPEAGELLGRVFKQEGITVLTGVTARRVTHDAAGFTVTLADGSALHGRQLLAATGRRADLAAAGVGAVGLDEDAEFVTTDGRMRIAPGVYAIGDMTGHGAFTHMSMYEGAIVVADILGRPAHDAEYHAVPRVTFTDPEIGAVGLTEAQARAQGLSVATAVSQVPESARGWIHKAGNDGFIKLVADTGRGVLVGATSAGPDGGEVLSMLTLAVHAAVPVRRLAEMIYAYPTFHGAVQDAIKQLAI